MSPITHAKVSGVADSPDTSLVRPSEWNQDHVGSAEILRETGGPTDLPIGAIAAGEFLRRVGAAIVGAAAPTGLYSDYIHIREEQASGVDGGAFNNGAWRTRVLNVELQDTGGDAALAANQITLQAGTYRCLISCPAHYVDSHKARLQNITDGVTILIGTSEFAYQFTQTIAVVRGRFILAAAKVLEVQHRCQTTVAVTGLGVASTFGVIEVYTEVELWKEA